MNRIFWLFKRHVAGVLFDRGVICHCRVGYDMDPSKDEKWLVFALAVAPIELCSYAAPSRFVNKDFNR